MRNRRRGTRDRRTRGSPWPGGRCRPQRGSAGAGASAHAEESCAEFISADAHALPFTDGMFAGARVERALQHMDDPSAVVREMSRVVCAGGRVVALEPDWDTLVLSGDDLATQRAIARVDSFRHPDIGRRLAALFVEAGLELRGL